MVSRILYTLLATITMVFFSEKAYWYVQGYAYFELILYYAIPIYACLWAMEYFRVRRISAIVLVASLYAFLVEGVLTPVIYEAGLLDPVMPMYFVGWHGIIGLVFGWYYLQKWTINRQWDRIVVSGFVFGFFWGVWSITFWLPENYEEWSKPGMWPVDEYAMYVFTFTSTLILGQAVMARWMNLQEFKPTKYEKWITIILLVVIFSASVALVMPLAIFKLAVLIGFVILVLRQNRKKETGKTALAELAKTAGGLHAAALLVMPLTAVIVYAFAAGNGLSETFIRSWLMEGISLTQALLGAIVFVWATLDVFRFKDQATSEVMQH